MISVGHLTMMTEEAAQTTEWTRREFDRPEINV
jgi:hypothetical protein